MNKLLKTVFPVISFFFSNSLLFAALVTNDGQTFSNYKIINSDNDRVVIKYKTSTGGSAIKSIEYKNLTNHIQKKLAENIKRNDSIQQQKRNKKYLSLLENEIKYYSKKIENLNIVTRKNNHGMKVNYLAEYHDKLKKLKAEYYKYGGQKDFQGIYY